QKDPLIEYKNSAFSQFEKLVDSIDDGIVNRIFKVQIVAPPEVTESAAVTTNQPVEEIGLDAAQNKNNRANHGSTVVVNEGNNNFSGSTIGGSSVQVSSQEKTKKLGRNDPCWCGS